MNRLNGAVYGAFQDARERRALWNVFVWNELANVRRGDSETDVHGGTALQGGTGGGHLPRIRCVVSFGTFR